MCKTSVLLTSWFLALTAGACGSDGDVPRGAEPVEEPVDPCSAWLAEGPPQSWSWAGRAVSSMVSNHGERYKRVAWTPGGVGLVRPWSSGGAVFLAAGVAELDVGEDRLVVKGWQYVDDNHGGNTVLRFTSTGVPCVEAAGLSPGWDEDVVFAVGASAAGHLAKIRDHEIAVRGPGGEIARVAEPDGGGYWSGMNRGGRFFLLDPGPWTRAEKGSLVAFEADGRRVWDAPLPEGTELPPVGTDFPGVDWSLQQATDDGGAVLRGWQGLLIGWVGRVSADGKLSMKVLEEEEEPGSRYGELTDGTLLRVSSEVSHGDVRARVLLSRYDAGGAVLERVPLLTKSAQSDSWFSYDFDGLDIGADGSVALGWRPNSADDPLLADGSRLSAHAPPRDAAVEAAWVLLFRPDGSLEQLLSEEAPAPDVGRVVIEGLALDDEGGLLYSGYRTSDGSPGYHEGELFVRRVQRSR